jgi:hypothetical protein
MVFSLSWLRDGSWDWYFHRLCWEFSISQFISKHFAV